MIVIYKLVVDFRRNCCTYTERFRSRDCPMQRKQQTANYKKNVKIYCREICSIVDFGLDEVRRKSDLRVTLTSYQHTHL